MEKLETSSQDWQCTFDALTEPVLILDTDYVIVRANIAAYKLLASDHEDILGHKCFQLFVDSPSPCKDCPLEVVQERGRSYRLEVDRPYLGKSLRVTCAPMYKGNELIGYVHSAVDITQQRNLEKQLVQAQKMEAIATLAGGIAHDFNNILGAILGNADLLLYRLADADQEAEKGNALGYDDIREHLAAIQKAGLRAKDLVGQILDFSRQTSSSRRNVCITPMVKEAMKLLQSSLPSTIALHADIDTGVGHIFADSTQVHQILMNLCTNAVEALKDQHGRIDISLQEKKIGGPKGEPATVDLKNGEYVVLSVRDNGVGMTQDVMERIYEPFFTTREVGEGTGMGLAVLHGIVTTHNAIIDVKSEPGKGTLFSVFFPKIKGWEELDARDPATNLPIGTETIVFVDDDEDIVTMHTEMLEYLGYTIIPATSGAQALDFLKNHLQEVDMVITDLTMPNMTGLELSTKIRKLRMDIPVILCSGYAESVADQRAQQAGISKFLAKPFDMKALAVTIRQVLFEQQ